MCLTIDQFVHRDITPIKVMSDMTVWKVVERTESGAVFSMYQNFRYKPGQKYHVDMRVTDSYSVQEGFHAYVDEPKGRFECSLRHYVVEKFTIPAGSMVYYGLDNDIVSDQIVFG